MCKIVLTLKVVFRSSVNKGIGLKIKGPVLPFPSINNLRDFFSNYNSVMITQFIVFFFREVVPLCSKLTYLF